MATIGWQGKCYRCGEPTWLSDPTYKTLKRTGQPFHCPFGHPQVFNPGKTEADKLREQIEAERRLRQRAEQRIAEVQDDARRANEQAEHERRRANGYKGHAAKITKRAKSGVCPCCNRHFTALERHMASKHPQFTALELEDAL